MTLPGLSATKGGQTRTTAKARRDGCCESELNRLTMEVSGMKKVALSRSILLQRKTLKTRKSAKNNRQLLLRLPPPSSLLLSRLPPIKFPPPPPLSIQVLLSSVVLVLSPHQCYLSPICVWTRTAWNTLKLSCRHWWLSWWKTKTNRNRRRVRLTLN